MRQKKFFSDISGGGVNCPLWPCLVAGLLLVNLLFKKLIYSLLNTNLIHCKLFKANVHSKF